MTSIFTVFFKTSINSTSESRDIRHIEPMYDITKNYILPATFSARFAQRTHKNVPVHLFSYKQWRCSYCHKI